MCEGGQVWGHARRRGYAAAEIWPKSDFDVHGVHCVQRAGKRGGKRAGKRAGKRGGKRGGAESRGSQNDTFTRTSEGVSWNTTERGSNL